MAKRNQDPPAPESFEQAVTELEQILSDLEAGQVPLEQAMARYQRGTALLSYCRVVLSDAERKIEELSKTHEPEKT